MNSGRIAYLRQSLKAFRSAFDAHTGDDLVRRAWLYFKCIENATLLRRFGENAAAPALDYLTIWGIEQVLGESPDSRESILRDHAEQLADVVRQSEDADSIPPEVVDEIVETWQERLDVVCWLQHFECYPQETLRDPYKFTERFRNLSKSYAATHHLLPTPEPVAERLRALSRELFLEGSPLTPWWTLESDMEVLLGAADGALVQTQDKPTDWERAPEALKGWDMALILRGIEASVSPHPPAEKEVAADLDKIRVSMFLIAVAACHQVRAYRPVGRTDAEEPIEIEAGFTKVGTDKWKLYVEDEGLNDGCWSLRVCPPEPLTPTLAGGRHLRRLIVSPKGSLEELSNCCLEEGYWQVRLPLRRVEGLSKILELPPDIAKDSLAAIMKDALTSFFDWTLDS